MKFLNRLILVAMIFGVGAHAEELWAYSLDKEQGSIVEGVLSESDDPQKGLKISGEEELLGGHVSYRKRNLTIFKTHFRGKLNGNILRGDNHPAKLDVLVQVVKDEESEVDMVGLGPGLFVVVPQSDGNDLIVVRARVDKAKLVAWCRQKAEKLRRDAEDFGDAAGSIEGEPK